MDKQKQRATAIAALANTTDWELFKTQKAWLIEQSAPEAEGLLNWIDEVQDILTDFFDIDKYRIFQLMDDEGNTVTPAIDQFKVVAGLNREIDINRRAGQPDNETDWQNQCGILLSVTEAQDIITLINLNNLDAS